MAILGWLAHLGQLGMEDQGEEPGWEVWLGGGRCLCHLLTILVPTSIAVLLSIAILLEKGRRSCCLYSTNFSSLPSCSDLWGLDIVFGGTLPQGWRCWGPWDPFPLLPHISSGPTYSVSVAALLCPTPSTKRGGAWPVSSPSIFPVCCWAERGHMGIGVL